MRVWLILGATLMLAGCVGPHSTGSLWALQNAQMDTELFRTSDTVRADQAHAYELSLAGEALTRERARLGADLAECPSARREPLSLSTGDRVRDEVRMWIGDDRGTLRDEVAQVALADWLLRRANATGSQALCEAARATLAGTPPSGARSPTIDALGSATVKRSDVAPFGGDTQTAWSQYALGTIDAVTVPEPLARYLGAAYGGAVAAASATAAPSTDRSVGDSSDDPAAATVDRIAAAYPAWEPDALYLTLRERGGS